MVGRQIIASSVFASKGKLSVPLMRSLMVRGGGLLVNDCLQRFGWSGRDPVATTIITTDTDSGTIRGVRYETRGQGPEVKFAASELWETQEDINVTIKINDLSILDWLPEGEYRNQTNWMDCEDVLVNFEHGERGRLTLEDLETLGIGNFCMRFTLLPMKVDKAMLYGGIVPFSRDQLREKVEDMGAELTSPNIPTIAMKLGVNKGVHQNGLLLTLSPSEDPEDKVGMGHYPILESIGSTAPVFPDPDDVAKQLNRMLRNNHATNNVNGSRLKTILQADTLPSSVTGQIRFEWPEYTGNRPMTTATQRNATGYLLSIFQISMSECKSPLQLT